MLAFVIFLISCFKFIVLGHTANIQEDLIPYEMGVDLSIGRLEVLSIK